MTLTTHGRPVAAALQSSLPLLLAVVLLLAAAGCNNNAVELNTTAEFEKALQSDKPVIILFWKFGCASCMFLEPGFEQLATEYKGRVFAGRIMIMNLMFISPFPELQRKYEIGFVPVVILFQDGQEKKRWTIEYSLAKYEKALTELVGPPDGKPGAATQPASRPASQPAEPDEGDAMIEAALKAGDAAQAPSTQPATQPANK
ncbi:MAG: thioredoxin family protein [Planctomycetota bacterium]|nr:thioredoxin family protein [Planctomycetota bacterium]